MVNLLFKQFLKFEIEIKRRIMYKKEKDLGFTHPAVVDYSQELDVLLNRYFKQAS
ncbi:aspartyl-phosphate phosphatase Spo0E family protein [Lysinibacillus sphaericus]|uniref:aspartyl-phosphate phosphatase Spo0E family protein n=1 Tax=Lysinibacillus sphaericus TaxID=1421 RepID=UPI002E1F3F99|nr:aspartyl-phosphate phosphatase Spo0E family protein [Lysinibacillus sphaericus]